MVGPAPQTTPVARRVKPARVARALLLALVFAGLGACGGGDDGERRAPIGLVLLEQGQVEEGLAQLRQREPGGPDRLPGWATEGVQALLRQRQLDAIDSLLASWPPPVRWPAGLRYLAANHSVMRGDEERAIGLYEGLGDDPEYAGRALHELASLHLMQGRAAEAAEVARRGLAADAERQPLRLLLVRALVDQGETAEALQVASALPRSAARFQSIGEAWLAAGEPDSAVANLTQALYIAPSVPEVRYLLGQALLAQGNATRAAKALSPLAQSGEPYKDSQLYLSRAWRELGREAAADSMQAKWEWLDLERRVRELRAEGLRALRAGDAGAALVAFDGALELAPASSELHNDRGTALAQLGRMDEARTAFEEALRLAPGNEAARSNLQRVAGD